MSGLEFFQSFIYLVLQHGVLALGILPDNSNVDVLVVGWHSRERSALQHIHKQVQLISQGHVTRNGVGGLAFGLNVACNSGRKEAG